MGAEMGIISKSQRDIRELPAYSIAEAAHYLAMPKSTLRSWLLGQKYKTTTGERFFKPVIEIADKKGKQLSFLNLVEAHVLDAIRHEHEVSLPRVRKALDYLRETFRLKRPLVEEQFATDGLNLFVERYGKLLNISQEGQYAIRELLESHLRRIERDRSGLPIKLYLFTRKHNMNEPSAVVVDPAVSFGRPVLKGTGIATAIIAERYKAGESIDSLAEDYDRPRAEIEEAIRCELVLEAA